MKHSPEALLKAMDAIATSLANYSREAINRGAAGIFFSVGAASADVMSAEEYRRWGAPFDKKVLEAVAEAPFNVLHVHGNSIHFDETLALPAAAVNWSHFATVPSLAEGKKCAGKAVLGGINEATASRVAPYEIEEQVNAALNEAGSTGLLITPGCSVPTDTPVRTLQAIKDALTRTAR